MTKTTKMILLFISGLLFAILTWLLFSPPLTLAYPGLWIWMASVFLFFGVGIRVLSNKYFGNFFLSYLCLGIAGCILLLCAGAKVASLPLFHKEAYASLVEVKEGAADNYQMGEQDLSWMSEKQARALAERTLSNRLELLQTFHLSAGQILYLKDDPIYLFSLDHKKESAPGYLTVSLSSGKTAFVETKNPMAFQSTEVRNLIEKAYPSAVLGETHLEINDAGAPYWITYSYKPAVSFMGGKQISKIYVADPLTGLIDVYSPQDAPDWIDYKYPVELLMQYYNWKTKYNDYNVQMNEAYTILPRSGAVYAVANLSSANQNAGVAFLSPTTGVITQYPLAASSAQSAAEVIRDVETSSGLTGLSEPLLITQDNKPCFISPLYSEDGVLSQFIAIDGQTGAYTSGQDWETVLKNWAEHAPASIPQEETKDPPPPQPPAGEEGIDFFLQSGIVESYSETDTEYLVKLVAMNSTYHFSKKVITKEALDAGKTSFTFQYPPKYEKQKEVLECIPVLIDISG